MEPATTARSRCRACGRKIERGELRFGERRENAFGEGDTTLWFHPLCAAYSRPEPVLELLGTEPVEGTDDLRAISELSVAHHRLPRLSGAARSPTSKAHCRHCREIIEKDTWRIGLMFFEEFRFNPGGFIHAGCAGEYFGTTEIMQRLKHFSPELSEDDLRELANAVNR